MSSLWPQKLRQHWNLPPLQENNFPNMCPECIMLPINNGNEAPGESLVVDFTSELFQGFLLLRIRDCQGTTREGNETFSEGYFAGMNRRYQLVIKGKFLRPTNLTDCVTGFCLDRPCGKMPPKWIVKGGSTLR